MSKRIFGQITTFFYSYALLVGLVVVGIVAVSVVDGGKNGSIPVRLIQPTRLPIDLRLRPATLKVPHSHRIEMGFKA